MTGVSGTSKTKDRHYYYICQKKRTEKACRKENVRRDYIERQVALAIRTYALQDDVIEWIADSTVAYNERLEAQSHISILTDELEGVKKSIGNLMAAIEAGIITDTTKGRLLELEAQQSQLSAKIAAEKADIITVPREDIIAGLAMFRDGDVEDKKYQARLFDTFLIAVYLYDNEMRIVFSFSGKKNTVTVPLEAAAEAEAGVGQGSLAQSSFKLPVAPPSQKFPPPFRFRLCRKLHSGGNFFPFPRDPLRWACGGGDREPHIESGRPRQNKLTGRQRVGLSTFYHMEYTVAVLSRLTFSSPGFNIRTTHLPMAEKPRRPP